MAELNVKAMLLQLRLRQHSVLIGPICSDKSAYLYYQGLGARNRSSIRERPASDNWLANPSREAVQRTAQVFIRLSQPRDSEGSMARSKSKQKVKRHRHKLRRNRALARKKAAKAAQR